MIELINLAGGKTRYSANLRGPRQWVTSWAKVRTMRTGLAVIISESNVFAQGKMRIEFLVTDKDDVTRIAQYCVIDFASHAVMCQSLRNWRGLAGWQLFVINSAGTRVRTGYAGRDNDYLKGITK